MTLFTDGVANVKGSRLGIILKPPTSSTIRQSIKTSRLTNNESEYEAMIVGLDITKSLGAKVIEAKCDSLLVVNQVNKTFKVREYKMQRYLDKLHTTLHRFKEWTLQHVPREQNNEADALANLGLSVEEDEISSGNIIQLSRSVIEEGHAEINSTSLTWGWRNKYIEYLKNEKLPSDCKESRALRTKVARFTLDEDGILYRRIFDGSLAVYLGPLDTDYVLRDVHEGTCGNHSSAKSLIHKIIRVGYTRIAWKKSLRSLFENVINVKGLHR
ncbi:uncharacterized protein [Nicotiana sylvestris]|uniref:uncharacterized protein n=1 Tax=Nicotiana sylvestris TaxID=4096 RepID=UPI00388C77EC